MSETNDKVNTNTGAADSQISILTERIESINTHLKGNKKDNSFALG